MQDQLESLVDRFGIHAVLDMLSAIAGLKAEHIRTNWQDEGLAEQWETVEAALDAAASKVLDCDLPVAHRS